MSTTDGTNSEPLRVPLSDQLGLAPERAAFEAWVATQPGHPFAGVYTTLMRKAWNAAVAAERERIATRCIERAQLSWAAADQPYAPEVKMQYESVAAAMEELAGELRA